MNFLRYVFALLMAGSGSAAAQRPDSIGTATLSDSGIVVRFPRSMSPDSITREMPVLDLFSGYEWRVALVNNDQAMVTALVVAPNDSLRIHRYGSIKDLYMAGDLRSCQRNDLVIECNHLARGLVREVDGRVEIAISDRNWLLTALQASDPVIRLIVKRNRETLWMSDIQLTVAFH